MSGVTLNNVIKRYGDVQVIHGIDLEIEDGEFCVFVGPSGCGKSTLLRMVAGLEETTEGQINIGKRDVTRLDPAERGVAMVFQTYALYPHMTVEENMGFGLKMNGHPKAEIKAKVAEASRILQAGRLSEAQARGPVGRSAPARRHRPRHRARARGVPVRRALVEPRCRTARRDAGRDRAAAQRDRRDDDLRHPRPGRGDDAGRQDRGAARGPYRAGRRAAGICTAIPTTSSSPGSSARRR